MFLKTFERLRRAFFRQGEVRLLQAMHRYSIFVEDDDIDNHLTRLGTQHRNRCRRGLCGGLQVQRSLRQRKG
jgi:hypothetical protein